MAKRFAVPVYLNRRYPAIVKSLTRKSKHFEIGLLPSTTFCDGGCNLLQSTGDQIRNILDKTAKKYQSGLQTELQEMFHSATMEKVRARRDAILADYSDVAEEAMRCLEEGFESAMIVMHLDEYLRRYYRTSNHLERLNKELKRRSKVISIFPNGDSAIRLMSSVLVEHHNACQAKRKIFSPENYQKLMNSGTRLTLIHVAQQQRQLLVA